MLKVEGRKRLAAIAGAALAVNLAGAALAQQAGSGDAAPVQPSLLADQPKPAGDWADQLKHPVDWFKWGADLRLRHEHIFNPFLTDSDPPGHEWGFERYRARIWDTITPVKNLDINTRLTWEGRHWWEPGTKEEWDWSDVAWDNLNVRLTMPELNSTVTVGRQDMIFGDGWLILEGTPLDGSRTIYFDAARLTTEFKDIKTTVDAVFIANSSDSDTWLCPIGNREVPVIEQDEVGGILYVTNKSLAHTQVDGYFIYKQDNAQLPNGDNGEIYTLGSRVVHDFNANWRLRAEGAYEFGERTNPALFPDTNGDLSAFGFNSQLQYSFNDPWKDRLHVGYEFLSGDDPNSSTNEQFDPLWGRWPQWSELLVYTDANENRIAETTNLHRINIGWMADPTRKLQLAADYHLLFRDKNSEAGRPGFSDSGELRGHLFTAVARYKFNQHMSGHVMGEFFIPGNYYQETSGIEALDTREDPQAYLRVELVFTL